MCKPLGRSPTLELATFLHDWLLCGILVFHPQMDTNSCLNAYVVNLLYNEVGLWQRSMRKPLLRRVSGYGNRRSKFQVTIPMPQLSIQMQYCKKSRRSRRVGEYTYMVNQR